MRERSTTAPCSHLVGPNNSTGHVFLEISSRNYDHKESYKSDWHSGSSCETGLIPEGSRCPPLSWQETPLGRAVNCHQVAQAGAMHESRKTDPQLNPLNSGKTRDDMKPASPQFLINVVNIWRDWAPPSEKSSFDNHYTKHSGASLRLPHLGLSCKQICLKNEILWRFQKPSPFEVLPCVESQAVDKFITTFQSISKALRDPTGIFTLENLHKLVRNPQNE